MMHRTAYAEQPLSLEGAASLSCIGEKVASQARMLLVLMRLHATDA
jgi:hypothetical protein